MYRGYSSLKKCWLYGLHVKRVDKGILRHYIIPDNDRSFKVFLYNKKEYEVIPESVGAFCESINAYDGDIIFQNGKYGVLKKKVQDRDSFFIAPTTLSTTSPNSELSFFNIEDLNFTGENYFQKENMLCTIDKNSPIHFSMIGKEYGRMRLECKTNDPIKKEIVKTKSFFEDLDLCLERDKDWFISEQERNLDNVSCVIAKLLPYLQIYVNESATKQGCFYTEKEYDNFEICAFDFLANGKYYNVSSVLGSDTITTVFRYRKKPRGKIVDISVK